MLNRLTLLLAPVALASVLLYSFSKRWTLLSHLLLGWCLSIAPTGAWIAVRGALDSPVPLLLSLVVMLWTAGFDVLYACQDYDFDVQAGLHSIPRRFGIARALWIARCSISPRLRPCLAYTGLPTWRVRPDRSCDDGRSAGLSAPAGARDDLSKLNAAFFTTNAFVSVILFVTFGGAALLRTFS